MGTSRAEIWRKYLIGSEGNIYIKRKLYHNSISNYSYPISEKIINTIRKDIPRTNIIRAAENNSNAIETLLTQYVQIMPCDGYLQGFNYIMAVLYEVYSKDDKEHAMSDTWWSFLSIISIIRPMIPDHDPNDFFRYTKKWSKYFIKHVEFKSMRLHTFLKPHYDLLLHTLTVKWLMIWFSQLFNLEDVLHVWDALITCEGNRRTKLMAIIAANITLQMEEEIEKLARNRPSDIVGKIYQMKPLNGKRIIEDSRVSMIELKLPGV